MRQIPFLSYTRWCYKTRKTMFSSRETRYCVFSLIILVVLINAASLEARKISGFGSRSRSSSSSRSSSRPSSGGISRPSVHVPSSHGTSRQPPRPHVPASMPHTPHSSGNPSPKDSSNILIHSEGGGRTRPAGTVTDHKQQSTPHQPSAPTETISKSTAGNVHTQSSPHGGSPYPPWANPGAAPHGGSNPHAPFPGSTQPHGSAFPNGPHNQPKPTGPLTSAPYPPTHPPGPISHQPITPNTHPSQSAGAPHGSYPYPNSPHGIGAPYPPSVPYPGGHPPGMPMPNAPHIGFGNAASTGGVHHPIGAPHSYPSLGAPPHGGPPHTTVIHNHYNSPVGSPQNPAGAPNYGHQPVYGGAPMGQPFVPGQTTIFLPNQQSSSPGIGQLVKEALVFSTVNAGVNRLINGAPHHHHHDQPAAPAAASAPSSTSTVTNTVIYNNQYGPPDANGAPNVPGAVSPAPGFPAVPGASPAPAFPGVPAYPTSGFPATPGSSPPADVPPGSSPRDRPSTSYPNIPPYPGAPSYSNANTSTGYNQQNTGASSTVLPSRNPTPAGSTAGSQPTPATANNTNNPTAPPAINYFISNEELSNLTENLFKMDEYNVSQHVTLNLQNRLMNVNDSDVAPAPLIYVQWEAHEIPTIKILREIYDFYEFDANKKENVTQRSRKKHNVLLDTFLQTETMLATMRWLSSKGYIEPDSFEWKDTLRHIWMTRVNGATSGFERIFLAEKYDGPVVLGGQNWVYFENQESRRRINYMGYTDSKSLGRNSHLVKVNFKIDGVMKPTTTMLVGTPPELEMALYTICYYTRPSDICTVSLGGVKFSIYTHPFRYFGKDLIDLGIMSF